MAFTNDWLEARPSCPLVGRVASESDPHPTLRFASGHPPHKGAGGSQAPNQSFMKAAGIKFAHVRFLGRALKRLGLKAQPRENQRLPLSGIAR
jgi:hypothetical protein